MLGNSINNIINFTPLLAKIIEKDIDAAKIHLNNHVTTEEQILRRKRADLRREGILTEQKFEHIKQELIRKVSRT
jgi:hypothetical protein